MKRFLAILLVALLVIRPGLSSYATEITENPFDSTPSNALSVQPRVIGTAPNSVNRAYVYANSDYQSANGYAGTRTVRVSNNGSFTFSAPSPYYFSNLFFSFPSRALPYDGVYDMVVTLIFDVDPIDQLIPWSNDVRLDTFVNSDNAETQRLNTWFSYPDLDIISDTGQMPTYMYYGSSGSIAMNQATELTYRFNGIAIHRANNTSFQLVFNIKDPSSSVKGGTFSGHVYISFIKSTKNIQYTMTGYNSDFTQADSVIDGLPDSIQGVQDSVDSVKDAVDGLSSSLGSKLTDVISGITNLPGEIADSFQDHFDNVLTQLHYITDQLQALWDQLSAFFSQQLIPQMITDTNRIVEAIENIDHQVEVDLSALKAQLAQQHQEQIANDNQNTEKIVNGYENNDMDSVTGDMSSSIDAYDTVEGELYDKVHGYLTGFTFNPNLISGYVQSITVISTIMTGFFNIDMIGIPLQLGLTLTIALLLIGWYRFKSGG